MTSTDRNLLIFGASARAAAFSASRAGLRPWCADLFADLDLKAHCPIVRVAADDYPAAFARLVDADVSGPWTYTGGLENHPALIDETSQRRPLWGNSGRTLRQARSPFFVAQTLTDARLPCPAISEEEPPLSDSRRWLVKPRRSAGGRGIRFWTGPREQLRRGGEYYQEWIAGESWAAVYLGDGQAQLLGVTRQMVGETWLHAAPFHYCGSLGPLTPPQGLRTQLEWVGNALVVACGLRGLFGVDGVVRDGLFWPLEVNPRYTASVEVLEYATDLPALALHADVFQSTIPPPPALCRRGSHGKAILFAREPLTFPADGPWLSVLRSPPGPWDLPEFADVPAPGEPIPAGRPVLTFFARGGSPADCLDHLRRIAVDLDRWLYGR